MTLQYKKQEARQISEHFNSNEFDCTCDQCKITLVSIPMVTALELLRTNLNTPIKITSGYRCANKQNQLRLMGYETSKGTSTHELGEAVDITNGIALGLELEEAAQKAGFSSIGVGKHWVHVDMRDFGNTNVKRRWSYGY